MFYWLTTANVDLLSALSQNLSTVYLHCPETQMLPAPLAKIWQIYATVTYRKSNL